MEDVRFTQTGMTMIATAPKEDEFKKTTISRYDKNPNICPVATVEEYIKTTKNLRSPTAKKLFVIFRRPHSDCTDDTLGRWTKAVLEKVGISTTPHKIRSAATSQAIQEGISLDTIMEKANWTSCQTFKNHYWRPIGKEPVRMNGGNEEHPRIDELHSVTMFIQGCSNSLRTAQPKTQPKAHWSQKSPG